MVGLEGLEPSTCRLWVEETRGFDGCNWKNFKEFFDVNSPCVWHPRLSRNLPMIHYQNWIRAYGFELPESQHPQGIMADRTMNRTRTGSEIMDANWILAIWVWWWFYLWVFAVPHQRTLNDFCWTYVVDPKWTFAYKKTCRSRVLYQLISIEQLSLITITHETKKM